MTGFGRTTFNRVGRRLINGLLVLSGLFLVSMMVITTVDVTGRFVLSRSLAGSTEMVSVALAVAVALSLPAVTWVDGHIALGLFQGPKSSPVERIRSGFVGLLSTVTLAGVAVVLWQHAVESAEYEDVIGYLELPVAPMVFVLSVMAGLTAAVFCARAVGRVYDGDGAGRALDEPAPETDAKTEVTHDD